MSTKMPVNEGYTVLMDGGKLANKAVLSKFLRVCVCVCVLSHVWLFAIPGTVAHQAPLFMGFPRQEHWSGLPFPPPGALPDPATETASPESPVAGRFFIPEPAGQPGGILHKHQWVCFVFFYLMR